MAGRDIAEFGIKLDATGAIASVDAFGASLDATAKKAEKFTATAEQTNEAWKRSGGSISAFNTIIGQMRSQWESANAVAEQATRTMNTQAEAARGLAQASTPAGRAMALMEIEAYKMDAAMGQSTKGVNQVRSAMTSMAASVANTTPGVAQLTSVLGAQAIGSTVMIGVLAGVSALITAYKFVTREAREAAEAQDKAVASLKEWQRLQAFGAAGKFGAEVAEAKKQLVSLGAAIAEQNARIARFGENSEGGKIARSIVGPMEKEYAELAKVVQQGEARVAQVRSDASEAAAEKLTRDLAQLVASHRATAAEVRNAQLLVAGLQQSLDALSGDGSKTAERTRLIGQIKELNEALHPKSEARAAAKDEAADIAEKLRRQNDAMHERKRLYDEQTDAAIRGVNELMHEEDRQNKTRLDQLDDQYQAAVAATLKLQKLVTDANKIREDEDRKYADEMQAILREGAGRIAADFVRSMSRGFEEVYSLAVKLMKRMEEAQKASGFRYQALKYGAAAIGGGLAGYGAGQAIGEAGGNAAQGALGGAASGAMAGAAFGPWGALVGGIAGAAAGLFGFGKAAKEAAKQMAEAQKAVRLSITGAEAETRGDTLGAGTARIKAEIEQMRKAVEDAFSGGGANSAQVRNRNVELARLNALEAERLKQLRDEIALKQRQAEEDVRVQILRNNGDEAAADAMTKAIDQERRFIELRAAGISDALIEELRLSELTRDTTAAAVDAKQKADEEALRAAQELEKAAQAAADAAKAAYDQARAVEDINVELTRARGDTSGADAMQFQLEQQRRLEDAQKNQSAEYVQKLLELQQLQRDSRAAQQLIDSTTVQPGGGGGPVGASSASAAFSSTVTERTGLALLDIGRTHTSLLRQIATNTGRSAAIGGAGSVDYIDDGLGTKAEHDKLFSGSVAR